MTKRAAIILAAGQGTRMRSSLPKVLHAVGGKAMIDWSVDLAKRAGCETIIVVTSPNASQVGEHVLAVDATVSIATQDPPLGTGHAVQSAQEALAGFSGHAVVLYGDTPLIQSDAIDALFAQLEAGADLGVLGFHADDPGAYGRLVTDPSGDLKAIVEARDASDEQLRITLCNSGVMAGRADRLFELLDQISNDNAKGEYYLTDIVGISNGEGRRSAIIECPESDVLGVNSRVELASAEAAFQDRFRTHLLQQGVTMTAPETVFFSHDTLIEADVTIEPHNVFAPGVQIASGCRIRSFCHLEGASVAEDCEIGPYARLRPGTRLEAGVKIGNFVEVKKTKMGAGAKANHLAYLGDGDVGAGANIGAGTVFCNYDGFFKYQTVIGEGAFIGSNSALVAPVKIADGAYIGSGSVVTEDVEADSLAIGRARQTGKAGWASGFRDRMLQLKKANSSK
ncbi:MAG: bifunctional UDP-N-acetylglucosamine diphosphorylase/glucosamine-1-phosphate N-acetyltransferase GlmU [Pseudomonadota bacterium]